MPQPKSPTLTLETNEKKAERKFVILVHLGKKGKGKGETWKAEGTGLKFSV